MRYLIAMAGVLCLVLSIGCASSNTFGDQMKARGELADQIGKDWNHGDKMVKKGEKLLEESSKLVREAEEKKAKSEELIAKGMQLKSETEASFATQFPTPLTK